MNTENIEYRCCAACKHNGRIDTRTYSPCHLKNKGLKRNKETRACYGDKCGFFVDNIKGE